MGSERPNGEKPRVLVVDDELVFIKQTQECLNANGFEVITARNGRDAVALASRGEADLVLLDIIMPAMNGVEVTRILRETPATADIPIIVISTMTEYKDRVEFFRIGANDYMPKPIDNGELLARVRLQLQLVMLRKELENANQALLQKNNMLEKHLSRIEHELGLARKVQRSLLPATSAKLGNISVWINHISCEDLGSDFIDYTQDEDGAFHMIIADVSGHGIASALLAAQLKVLFLTMVQRKLPPSQLMDQINQLSQRFLTDEYYFTAIYMHHNPQTNQLSLVNGGHVPLVYYDYAAGKLKQIESSNAPLGFFQGERYQQVRLTTQPGDLAVLFTDGISEHMNSSREMFEIAGVLKVVETHAHDSADKLADLLIKRAREFGDTPVFNDDVTVGVVKFGG